NARIWHRPIRNKPPKKKPFGKSQRLRSGKKQLLRLFDFFLSLDLCFFHKLTSLLCFSQARFSAKTGLAKSWTLIARRRGTKSWILPRLTTDNLSSDRFYLRNVKRNRPELATVHREINRIFAKLWQTNLLNDHDEMRGDGEQTGREVDRQGRVKLGHHDVPVLIREGQADPMITLLDGLETQPAGNGTLGVRNRRFESP